MSPVSPSARTPRTPSRRFRKAVARVCAQKAVLHALEPEPAWRELRSYAALFLGGLVFSPISQAILVTAIRATCEEPEIVRRKYLSFRKPSSIPTGVAATERNWWWPMLWWQGLWGIARRLKSPQGLRQFLCSSVLFALHDAVTRGRTHRVEQATDVGAHRAKKPLLKSVAIEAVCGVLGAKLSFEYMRSALNHCTQGTRPSWSFLSLGAAAGVARGFVVATGGHRPLLQTACSWSEFLLEVVAENQGARILGFSCPLFNYLTVVLWGIANFLPWGLLVMPCNRLVLRFFGEDPIVQQKAVLQTVVRDLQESERGRSELAFASLRATEFFANIDLCSLWRRVQVAKGAQKLLSLSAATSFVASTMNLASRDAAQHLLDELLHDLAISRAQDLKEMLTEADGLINEHTAFVTIDSSSSPIVVRRCDMVRAALTQIAQRPVEDLLLGVTASLFAGLQGIDVANLLGLRVQFVGEDAVDVGGVRREFMDCFAEALTRSEEQMPPLALVEPLELLGLGADSTWRPVPCDEEGRGYLWAFGRLLALALVYRCPCPIQLSSLVFKCLLGVTLRPGDVKQLDPDFWTYRVRPLLENSGVEVRQQELRDWGMDVLTFTSADGIRELKPDGRNIEVSDSNKEDYAQLLCEDFLIGPVRAEIGCLVMGFHELVPKEMLKSKGLDAEQLRMLVCGVAELDVDEWEAHTVVEGSPEVAKWFFDWLRKKPQEARSKMLAFTTGSSVLPSGWSGLRDPNGQPLPFRVFVDQNLNALPHAHTCTNLLVLPPVTSRHELERRLDKVLELSGREMLLA